MKTDRFSIGKTNRILVLILILSFLVRLIPGLFILDGIPKSYGWYQVAKNVLEGKKTLMTAMYPLDGGKDVLTSRYYSVRPPLHIFFYMTIIELFNESLLAFLLIQSIFSLIYVFLAFRLFANIFSHRVSLVGAAAVGFYPYFISRSWNSCEDNLYFLFIIGSIYFLSEYFKKQRVTSFMMSSVFLGLAFLTRNTILFFVPILSLFLLFMLKKNRIRMVILYGLLFLTMAMPLLYYNYTIYQKFMLSDHGGSRFWVSNNPYVLQDFPGMSIDRIEARMFFELNADDARKLKSLDHLGQESFLMQKTLKFIKENPVLYVKILGKKLLAAISLSYHPYSAKKNMDLRRKMHYATYIPLFILGILGFLLYAKNEWKISLIMAGLYLSLLAVSMVFWAHTRHTIPYHIFYIYGALLFLNYNAFIKKLTARSR